MLHPSFPRNMSCDASRINSRFNQRDTIAVILLRHPFSRRVTADHYVTYVFSTAGCRGLFSAGMTNCARCKFINAAQSVRTRSIASLDKGGSFVVPNFSMAGPDFGVTDEQRSAIWRIRYAVVLPCLRVAMTRTPSR